MEFKILSTAEGARRSRITVRNGEGVSEGPSFVTPMWKGNIPHFTPGISAAEDRSPDAPKVKESLSPLAVTISDIVDDKKLLDICVPNAIRKMYGAQSSAADPHHVLYLIETHPSRSKPRPLNAKHITVQGKKGAIQVKAKDIVDTAINCGVDLILEPFVEATEDESVSRHRKCAVASLSVLDQCVEYASESGCADKVGFIGVIQGAATEKERTWYAGELSRRDEKLFGYSLGGFGMGESAEERNRLCKVVVDRINPNKPRWITKVGNPLAILDLIKIGVDFFVTEYNIQIKKIYLSISFSYVCICVYICMYVCICVYIYCILVILIVIGFLLVRFFVT